MSLLHVVPDVLDAGICNVLIEEARATLTPATVLTSEAGWREAEVTWLVGNERLGPVVADITGLPTTHHEALHVIHYVQGGFYRAHQDFFHPDTNYYDGCMAQGGQRLWSVMFCLADDYTGGQTAFPMLGVTVSMQRGMMLAWENVHPDGSLDYATLHEARPVESGEKWVATVWVREKERRLS